MATTTPITKKETTIPGGGETALPGGETTPEESTESTAGDLTDEEINSIPLGKVSPLDPTFIVILGVAIISDLVLDPLIETIGLPTIILPILNRVIDVITMVLIGGWIYWKSKQIVLPEKMAQRLKGMEKKILAKIQAKIQKKVASKAVRRVLIRAGGALVIEMIPGISLFTSWTVAVLSML